MGEKPAKIYLGKGKMKSREYKGKTYKSITGPSFGFGYLSIDIAEKDGEKVFYYTLVESPKKDNSGGGGGSKPQADDDPF